MIVAPDAGHAAMIADYRKVLSLIETLLTNGIDRGAGIAGRSRSMLPDSPQWAPGHGSCMTRALLSLRIPSVRFPKGLALKKRRTAIACF